MKRPAFDHRKTKALTRALAESRGWSLVEARTFAIGALSLLWHETSIYAADGRIGGEGRYSAAQIEAELGWSGTAGDLVKMLVSEGWLDRWDDGSLFVHDWPDHCEDFVQNRLGREVRRFADGKFPRIGRMSKDARAQLADEWFTKYKATIGERGRISIPANEERKLGEALLERSKDGEKALFTPPRSAFLERSESALPKPLPLPVPGLSPAVAVAVAPKRSGSALEAPSPSPASSPPSSHNLAGLQWDAGRRAILIDIAVCPTAPWKAVYFYFFGIDLDNESAGAVDDNRLSDWAMVCWIWHENVRWDFLNLGKMFDRLERIQARRRIERKEHWQAPKAFVWDSRTSEEYEGWTEGRDD